MLGVFKYLRFTVSAVSYVIPLFGRLELPDIEMPIGISFFTFQIMSYLIDVYRGDCQVQKSMRHLALYIMLFPQLIAGPIVRYKDIQSEITNRTLSVNECAEGLRRFIVGLAKKVIIADTMGGVADAVFNNVSVLSTPSAWLGAIAYTFQIYFDFSAYSDMAIGMGKVLGFHFLENFNYPYVAKSMQDFWRRWHISLSTWFRDYLYIPLGGNRKGRFRTLLNSYIVFFCTGLWHGAAWNFVLWGLYHGTLLTLEKLFDFNKITHRFPVFIRKVLTFNLIMIGWVFFRADSIQIAFQYIKMMFSFNNSNIAYFFRSIDTWNVLILFLAVILSHPISLKMDNCLEKLLSANGGMILKNILALVLFAIAVSFVAGSSFSPFIYFRF